MFTKQDKTKQTKTVSLQKTKKTNETKHSKQNVCVRVFACVHARVYVRVCP